MAQLAFVRRSANHGYRAWSKDRFKHAQASLQSNQANVALCSVAGHLCATHDPYRSKPAPYDNALREM
jgi:hypothetical protein